MEHRKLWIGLMLFAVLAVSTACGTSEDTRITEFKEKPPMYSYIAVWNIPPDQWEARKDQADAARKILDRAVSDGRIVAYGFDGNPLHDTFWLAMSKEGLYSVRDEFNQAGISMMPAQAGADPPPVSILISRYYNWHVGTWENAYVHVGIYKIKPDAPSDAVDLLSKNFFAPPFEKMLASGDIFEWETDTYENPEESPGTFLIAYLSATQEGLDKAGIAVQEALKARPSSGPAFESLVDVDAIRDVVLRSYAVYN